jgi:hypothetical protein
MAVDSDGVNDMFSTEIHRGIQAAMSGKTAVTVPHTADAISEQGRSPIPFGQRSALCMAGPFALPWR